MDIIFHELQSELRNTKQELQEKLNGRTNKTVKGIILEEIKDIEMALKKIETGEFGKCEISGELMPVHLLALIPTLKTTRDIKTIELYYRKSLSGINGE